MGFFKKLGKKLKGAFKKIGKGIKKGFQKFGKFMNKIGIMGQIAMFFILPAVGGAMLRGIGGMAGLSTGAAGAAATAAGGLGTSAGFQAAVQAAGQLSGVSGALAQGVNWTLKAAQAFSTSPVMRPFKTVTDALDGFLTNTTKYVGNKIGIQRMGQSKFNQFFADAPDAFFKSTQAGGTSVMGEVGQGIVDNISQFTYDIGQGRVFTTEARPKVAQLSMDDIMQRGIADAGVGQSDVYTLDDMTREGLQLDLEGSGIDIDVKPPSAETYSDRSLLGRTTTAAVDFVSPDNLLKMGRDTVTNIGESLKPSNLASNYVQQTAINPLLAPDAPRRGTPFGSVSGPVQSPSQDYSMAYASLMSEPAATSPMFSGEYDYFTAMEASLYGSPDGQWGGMDTYNKFMTG